jgi:ketosteroid isomerase-like protein
MKKKYGINIMLFVFIISLILIISCTKTNKISHAGILMKTDREFSEMSEREGMFKAFLAYIADDGVILKDYAYPSVGKETLRNYYAQQTDTTFILRWAPSYESISESGDLGYTYGFWTNTDRQTGRVANGTYLTIWRKQKDGSWKFVLDSGTQGLP